MPAGTLSYLIPPAHGLEVSVTLAGTTSVVFLRGEADIATLPLVVEALAGVIADDVGDVIVDLEQATFIDTGALRAVLRARQVLLGGGRQLTLRSPSKIARRLLEVFGLSYLVAPAAA